MVAGLKEYERKLRNSKKPGGSKLLRSARESYEGRTKRKMLAKTSWFKDRKRRREDEDLDDMPEGWNTKRSKTSDRTDPDHLPRG